MHCDNNISGVMRYLALTCLGILEELSGPAIKRWIYPVLQLLQIKVPRNTEIFGLEIPCPFS